MHSLGVPDNSIYIGKLCAIIGEVKHGNASFENGQAQLFAALFKAKKIVTFFPLVSKFLCAGHVE